MVAGTSTGSLLATALVMPHPDDPKKNKFYAEDAIEIYTKDGPDVFRKFELSAWGRAWGTIIFTLAGGLLGLLIGHKIYYNPRHEETMKAFKEYIKQRK